MTHTHNHTLRYYCFWEKCNLAGKKTKRRATNRKYIYRNWFIFNCNISYGRNTVFIYNFRYCNYSFYLKQKTFTRTPNYQHCYTQTDTHTPITGKRWTDEQTKTRNDGTRERERNAATSMWNMCQIYTLLKTKQKLDITPLTHTHRLALTWLTKLTHTYTQTVTHTHTVEMFSRSS